MGCGSSAVATGITLTNSRGQIEQTWDAVFTTLEVKDKDTNPYKNLVVKRSGWKTIRIFVSSTFRDFHQEREVLVKKVFPDLRVWCQSRRLHLVECDLRWGVPKDSTTESTLRTCLGEIDRCYQDNIMPFFVNMTSERIGWIPRGPDIPEGLKAQYKWIDGLSVTEMEIMHAAYRKENPNSIFMLRDPSFLEGVPESHRTAFVDDQELAPEKLKMLKKMIFDRFTAERVKTYQVKYEGYDEEIKKVALSGLDGTFSQTVFDFFKRRIEQQYPLMDKESEDPFERIRQKHEAFMKSNAAVVIGRDDVLEKVDEHICGPGVDKPLLLIGGAGSGKSSVMSRLADVTSQKAASKQIPGGGDKGWHVFYHFVGAVPGSTELEKLLKRLLKEMGVETDMVKDLDSAAQFTCGALNNEKTRPTVIIVDALNQLDNDTAAEVVSWVPKKLAPQIRCVFSMIPDTPQHKVFQSREPQPYMMNLTPLDMESRTDIIKDMLGKYNKALDRQQMQTLLSKESSQNPLWLSLACEELRVFGNFRMISQKIEEMKDGLLELEMQIMTRFEEENGGELLVATLCLLETSSTGLLETELLQILGDTDNLMQPQAAEGSEKDDSKSEKQGKYTEPLPAYKWAEVYRALRPFLRPFGDSGEGRLDFYHRSLSKAVRQKYLQNEKDQKWWNKKLAGYFENVQNLERKVEEYPHHLIELDDKDRLKELLTDWDIFEELFNIEYSSKLIKYWNKTCTHDEMEQCYVTKMENLVNDPEAPKQLLSQRLERLSRFLAQMGRYTRSIEYSSKAQTLEEELGSDPKRMADVHYNIAIVMIEKKGLNGFMDKKDLVVCREIFEHFEKSVELRRPIMGNNKEQKLKLGLALTRQAFNCTEFMYLGGNEWMSKDRAKEVAVDRLEEAMKLYEELHDDYHYGDALITRGLCEEGGERLKYYLEAEEKLVQSAGRLNPKMDRLLLNTGIHYEENGEYFKSYEYFHRWYLMVMDLYGEKHIKVKRCIDTLREPFYIRVANQLGKEIPAPYEP